MTPMPLVRLAAAVLGAVFCVVLLVAQTAAQSIFPPPIASGWDVRAFVGLPPPRIVWVRGVPLALQQSWEPRLREHLLSYGFRTAESPYGLDTPRLEIRVDHAVSRTTSPPISVAVVSIDLTTRGRLAGQAANPAGTPASLWHWEQAQVSSQPEDILNSGILRLLSVVLHHYRLANGLPELSSDELGDFRNFRPPRNRQ